MAKPYNISVNARGYQPLEAVKVTPSAGNAKVLKMTHARLSRGVAVDTQEKPVAGAEMRLFFERRDNSTFTHGSIGPLLATTDEAGRFTLDTLKEDTDYFLFVISKAGGRGFPQAAPPGQDGVRVTVGPKLTIKGKIKPGTDEKGKTSMPSTIDVTQFVPINLEHERLSPVTRRISVDGQGHFTATDLLACETEVEAGGRTSRSTSIGPRPR